MAGVWRALKAPWLPPGVFNSKYKLRHRRIFTSIMLHQMNRDLFSRVCGEEDEDFDHFFLFCPVVRVFREWLRGVLEQRCGVRRLEGQQWDWVWCFGLEGRERGRAVRVLQCG